MWRTDGFRMSCHRYCVYSRASQLVFRFQLQYLLTLSTVWCFFRQNLEHADFNPFGIGPDCHWLIYRKKTIHRDIAQPETKGKKTERDMSCYCTIWVYVTATIVYIYIFIIWPKIFIIESPPLQQVTVIFLRYCLNPVPISGWCWIHELVRLLWPEFIHTSF